VETAAILAIDAVTFLICLPVAGGLAIQTWQKLASVVAFTCGRCGRVYCVCPRRDR
jgi:hypothetical protein